jgi:thiosulfate/3-mercaptopyruvate sulfurtransferase
MTSTSNQPLSDELIIDISQLEALKAQARVLLVAVCEARVFAANHIPGSVLIQPAELVSGEKPAVGKLPDAERLSALFSRIGLTSDTHIVAYDDEGGGWAGRLIWTLDVLGHDQYSYLDGGLVAWLNAGQPVASGPVTVQPVPYRATINQDLLRTKKWVLTHLEDPDLQVWDARSPEEYRGERVNALRNGHIPGARNLDWLELMDRDNDLRLLPLDVIRSKLQRHGIDPDKALITHCQTHHRSGLTYLVGKALGLDIQAYDGSWAEWGNDPDTPIETGS